MIARITQSRLYLPIFWSILAFPTVWLIWRAVSGQDSIHYLLHPSGKYATRFLIIAMAATPLRMMFPRAAWTAWLVQSRRHWGVAACALAVLHTVFYLLDEGVLWDIVAGVTKPSFLLGWLAFAVIVALGMTSNDRSVQLLGPRWKSLQRWVYVCAVLSFLHWVLLGFNIKSAFVHFAPLAALQLWRMWRIRN